MPTTGLKDLLRRAYRAKDEGELSEVEKEAGGEAEDGRAVHVHVHPNRNDKRHDERDAEPGEAGATAGAAAGQSVARMEALERDIEELKAQHEDILGELSEDSRRRIGDKRDRRRDGRRRDATGEDARRREEDARRRDEERKREEDARRRHDESEAEAKKKEEEEKADDARRRDEANTKIEGELEMEAPPGTGDKARKARDSEFLVDSYQSTVAMAEILVPGQSFPTYDRAAAPTKTLDAICALRRTTLDLAYGKPEFRSVIDDAVGGAYPDRVKTMDCGQVRTLFRSLALYQRGRNNNGSGHRATDLGGGGFSTVGSGITPADINAKNKEFWKKQMGR